MKNKNNKYGVWKMEALTAAFSFAPKVRTKTPLLIAVLLARGRKLSLNFLAIAIIIGMNSLGLSAVGGTLAYFNDTEASPENAFTAAMLDFRLTNVGESKYIGVEVDGEIKVTTVAIQEVGSLDIQYEITTEQTGGDTDFCNGINLIAKRNGMLEYSGELLDFAVVTGTEFGVWEFELDAPPQPGNFAHGDKCEIDFVFSGWREDVVEFSQSGFTDEERIALDITARMIVLNEYLPNPVGNECSVDGEWVELFNNGDEAIDIDGWKVEDGAGHITTISTTTTFSGSTLIGAKGSGEQWLVVALNGCVLNNDGDSITLYDSSSVFIDSTSYSNTVTVPENKSNARIPDGIGIWIDPVPTPGGANILEEIELPQQFTNEDVNKGLDIPPAVEGGEDEDDGVGDEASEVEPPVDGEETPDPVSDETGTTTEPMTEETGTSTEPVSGESGTSTEPMTDETGTSTEPMTDEIGTSTVPVSGETGTSTVPVVDPEPEQQGTTTVSVVDEIPDSLDIPADPEGETTDDPVGKVDDIVDEGVPTDVPADTDLGVTPEQVIPEDLGVTPEQVIPEDLGVTPEQVTPEQVAAE